MNKEKTDSLYQDTEFGAWLDKIPGNVDTDYSEFSVDNAGTRVTITFTIEDEEV